MARIFSAPFHGGRPDTWLTIAGWIWVAYTVAVLGAIVSLVA